MYAIREIVSRDIFTGFEVPRELGDRFEMILVPIENDGNRERYEDIALTGDDSRLKKADKRDAANENEQFLSAQYNSMIEENEAEDAIWSKYL